MLHRNAEALGDAYVDDRLSHEPKSRLQKLRSGGLLPERRTPLLAWLAIILICYTVSLQEQAFALFTSVQCIPATVRAGANATCSISTFHLAAETDRSLASHVRPGFTRWAWPSHLGLATARHQRAAAAFPCWQLAAWLCKDYEPI